MNISNQTLKVKEKDEGVRITNALGWHSLVRSEDPDSTPKSSDNPYQSLSMSSYKKKEPIFKLIS